MLTLLEHKLLTVGYNALDTVEKNTLIKELARREAVAYNEITEDYILRIHKQLKTREFSNYCNSSINNGFKAFNGHTYRTGIEDQINLLGTKEDLNDDPTIETVAWKTEDVGYVVHSRADWLKMYREAFNHKKTTLYKYNTLKMAVEKAVTHEELIKLQWSTWGAQQL